MSKFKILLLALIAVLTIGVLAACGNDSDDNSDDADANETEETDATDDAADTDDSAEESEEASGDLSGSVEVDGSGTVYPLMSVLAENYMVDEQPEVSVQVARAGTSAGFEKFLAEDGTDFNDASREIKDEEQEKADELGIDVMELKVALDGLTIVTSPDNDWATELTAEQVNDIFLGNVTKWSEIDSSWPDEEIQPYGPNENHGTYEFFHDEILDEQDLVDGIDLQQEYSTLVTLVSEDENGIGFFGFGYYDSNQDQLNAVAIDFGDGGVSPSLDTIGEDGPYADYTRPVFTYLNVGNAEEKPEVYDYAVYVASHINDFAGETGFAPLPDEELQAQLEEVQAIQ
ncbi:PstS family phosphate ABC transporter substrate-binding protein [Gracilibacillus sp. S3-1-1]|uniref:PstS family phosphate ABC transporter substrate-binding protein n=1 Tax=Gracilibacillus pellucidus TaxID=3095368 RepID=A0ACC6M567_9BACI|nr:PstS family phosphate ABC transporter substrate-binding protein [Gracilibacillus sp. S3-1-1]MDX8045977.1 PstS family phosphate ABC transporter substrate-binding protein [Gracilibacillus sp. S3-1-1]